MQQNDYQYFDGSIFEHVVNNGQTYKFNPAFRVAGYSAFFTGLSDILQEDIIGRTEHVIAR